MMGPLRMRPRATSTILLSPIQSGTMRGALHSPRIQEPHRPQTTIIGAGLRSHAVPGPGSDSESDSDSVCMWPLAASLILILIPPGQHFKRVPESLQQWT